LQSHYTPALNFLRTSYCVQWGVKFAPTMNGPGCCCVEFLAATRPTWRSIVRWRWILALVFVLRATTVFAEPPTELQLRIAWGGGVAKRWSGTISLSEGHITDLRSLGIEPDQPGSIWRAGGRVHIRPRTPRSYDGVDLMINAPASATLNIEMTDDGDPAAEQAVRKQLKIPLSKLAKELHNAALDDRGNWILARRTPGDQLRVSLEPNRTVLTVKQRLSMTVQPHLLPVKKGATVRLTATWHRGRSGEQVITKTTDLVANDSGTIPAATFEFDSPPDEGVYTLKLAASHRPTLGWRQTLASRHVQFVVLDPNTAMQAPALRMPRIKGATRNILQIDRANPKWWERFTELSRVSKIPGIKAGISSRPHGSGDVSKFKHATGTLSALAPGGWEAYPLRGCEPGKPHELVVEYPENVSQQLAISIVEPNAAGAVVPIGLDSGVYVSPGLRRPSTELVKHRVVFWPKSKQPYVLLNARDPDHPAVFGKIQVNSYGSRLPWLVQETHRNQRMFAAYYNRPLVSENFSADETLDQWSGRSLDDWQTFYQGGQRLVEYLGYAGYNTLMLAVNSEGGAIYPSRLLEPTPKYDTGVFLSTGQDPEQKDVLGMLFEMFNRQQMRLIPVVQFGAPLPALEALLRREDATSVGVQWVGADGRTWLESNSTQRKLGPYYNVLHPQVQQAMLAVVEEIVTRYEGNPAYAGLAVELSAHSYAQLPGANWGFDDVTIGQFSRDTGVKVPGQGATRFATRSQFLMSDSQQPRWIKWRADRLAEFHQKMAKIVTAQRPTAKLYLAGTDMLAGNDIQSRLRPALPNRRGVAGELPQVGIVPKNYQHDRRIVLMHPYPISLPQSPVVDAVDARIRDWTVNESAATDSNTAAALFYHRPAQTYVAGLADQGPWSKEKTKPWIVSQMSESTLDNRRRFARMLAHSDAQLLVDGGWMLNLGQEESLADLVRVFRKLPAEPFATLRSGSDPVTIRVLKSAGQTYAYLVNNSPWDVSVTLAVGAPAGCRVESLAASQHVPDLVSGTDWTVDLKPYDVLGVRFNSASVALGSPRVVLPPLVKETLSKRIDQLTRQTAALRWPAAIASFKNPGFETSAGDARFVGWQSTGIGKTSLRKDDRSTHQGRQSAVMLSQGPVLSLRSDAMDPPTSGRVSISVWLRVADAKEQPPLRLAIEGQHQGRAYYRYASVGAGRGAVPIKKQWSQFIFQVDDLPVTELTDLRVRFDLMGAGEVWVDDVELFPLAFSDSERVELSKVISLAGIHLEKGKVGQCARILEGHWPKFLAANVPLSEEASSSTGEIAKRKPQPPAETERPPEKTGFLDRVRGALPF
jgi:hypothetical protein